MSVGQIPNSPYTPVVLPQGQPSGVGGATPAAPLNRPGETPGLRPPGGLSVSVAAGEVAYSSPNLEGIDWDALSSDFQSVESLSISITAIMVLMIDVMKEMRKGQREAWMDEAQNALQMGMNAADRMRESAAAKMAADVVTNAASMATAAISMVSSAASLGAMKAADMRIEARATALFGPAADVKPTALTAEAPKIQTPSTTPVELDAAATPSSATTSTTPAAETSSTTPATEASSSAASKTTDATPTQGEVEAEGVAEGHQATSAGKAGADSAKATSEADNQKARAQFVSQQRALAQAQFDGRANMAKSISEIGAAMARMGASVGEYFSGLKQAEAKEFEALGAYSQALMQAELEFANQMRDAIRTVIDTMKGAEQAKHQAMQGIYNI